MPELKNKFGCESEGSKDAKINEQEIGGLKYTDEGEYRVFHKKCEDCQEEFTTNIPLKFFKSTLPLEISKDNVLDRIHRKYCYDCEQEHSIG